MVRRRPATVMATAALLFGAGGPALASDELPDADTALVQVFVDSETDVGALSERYDLAEYKQVEADGSILLAIDATAAERAELRAAGYRIGAHDRGRRVARGRGRGARRAARARTRARRGVRRATACPSARRPSRTPGETVIQRAHKFTNYAGTFLYVEAHNKATIVTGTTTVSGPSQALSLRGRRRRLRRGDQHGAPDRHHDDPGHVPVPPPADPAHGRRRADPGRPDDRPRGLEHRRGGHEQGDRVAGREPPAARRRLPAGLLQPLSWTRPRTARSSTGSPRSSRTWSRRSTCRTCSPGYQRKAQTVARRLGRPGTTGSPLVPFTNQTGSLVAAEAPKAVVLTSKAWGHEGGNGITAQLVAGTGADAPLAVEVDRPRDQGDARHQRRRRGQQHRGPGRRRHQREPRRERARHGRDLPRQRGRRRPAHERGADAAGLPQRAGARPARPVPAARVPHRRASATARRSACSSPARCTRASGRPA